MTNSTSAIAPAPNWMRMDVAEVRRHARATWERQARISVPISERIGASVPYWLILVFAGIVVLSASHTITILSILSAWDGRLIGIAGVISIEFGALYASFRRKQLELRGIARKHMGSINIFSRFVFFTALFINVAGSLIEAMKQTGIAGMSASEAWQQFGSLPLTTQAAVIVGIIIGVFIPFGLGLAGEGMAALFLEREAAGDYLERQWAKAKQQIEREAIRDYAIRLGAQPKDAARFAWNIVKDDPRPSASASSEPDSKADSRTDGRTDKPDDIPAQVALPAPTLSSRPAPARTSSSGMADAKQYLRTHLEEVMGKPRPTWLAENVAEPKLGKQRWSEAIQAVRAEMQVAEAVAPEAVGSNGHGSQDGA